MILVDTAKLDEVKRAMELGYVNGVTTNPVLMARVSEPPPTVIAAICRAARGPVFYQVTASDHAGRAAEGRRVFECCPEQVVLKIPATAENMRLVAELAPGIPCAVTAIYSAQQGWVACEAGARYLIPYVNRAARFGINGPDLVTDLADLAESSGTGIEVLAASIKTPDEAAAVALAGAHHLTLPLDLILKLGDHPLSEQAVAEFNAAGRSKK